MPGDLPDPPRPGFGGALPDPPTHPFGAVDPNPPRPGFGGALPDPPTHPFGAVDPNPPRSGFGGALPDPPTHPFGAVDPNLPRSGRSLLPVLIAGVVFGLAGLLPALYFLGAAFSEDETATGSAADVVLWLVGIEVLVGGLLAVVGWAVLRAAHTPRGRGVWTALFLVAAGGWGLVTGFLGGVAIALERHPTWDDA